MLSKTKQNQINWKSQKTNPPYEEFFFYNRYYGLIYTDMVYVPKG